MADVPSEAPHKVAAKGASGVIGAFKRVPPVGWVLIVGVGLIYVLYKRHQQAQKQTAQSPQDATSATGSTPDPNAIDPATGLPYGQENAPGSGLDQAYLSGYDSGIYSNTGGLPTDIFGGVNSGGSLPSGSGPGGTATPEPVTVTTTVNNSPTGGGPPGRPAGVHQTNHSNRKPGYNYSGGKQPAPYGPHKPKPPNGFHVVGLGGGYWVFVPNKKQKAGTGGRDTGPDRGGDK